VPIPALQSVLYRCCDLSWFRPPGAETDGRDVCAGVELECGLWHRADKGRAESAKVIWFVIPCIAHTVRGDPATYAEHRVIGDQLLRQIGSIPAKGFMFIP
jgi:hypothetical protein